MKQPALFLALTLLLCMATVHAAPVITVDQNATICETAEHCYNSTLITDSLRTIPDRMMPGLAHLNVRDTSCRATSDGMITYTIKNDTITIIDCGLNVTQYTDTITAALQDYDYHPYLPPIARAPVKKLRYPLPSWMPRPGQCDMGVLVKNSRGQPVCTR